MKFLPATARFFINTIVGDEKSFRLWKMKSKVMLKNPPMGESDIYRKRLNVEQLHYIIGHHRNLHKEVVALRGTRTTT